MPTLKSVAFDATLWDEPTTGMGLVTRSLAQALENQGVSVAKLGATQSGLCPRGRQGRTSFTLSRLPKVLSQVDAPLFHALGNFNLPLWRVRGKKLVLTVHDVIPLLFPKTVSRAFYWQFRLWMHRSLQLADAVVCVSQTTKDDLLKAFAVENEKVVVIPNGVDHVHRWAPTFPAQQLWLSQMQLPPQFILYAGSLDLRKNVDVVLDAMSLLANRQEKVCLVWAGQAWFGSQRLEKKMKTLQSQGVNLRVLGYLPEEKFYALMAKASLFVFPSRYEGFGLPPLEAMALGVPTLAANAGSLPEVLGEGALFLPPDAPEAWAHQMSTLLADPEARTRLGQKGAQHAGRYTWASTAQATLQLYEKVLERT